MIDPSCTLVKVHHQFLWEEESEINETHFSSLIFRRPREFFYKRHWIGRRKGGNKGRKKKSCIYSVAVHYLCSNAKHRKVAICHFEWLPCSLI